MMKTDRVHRHSVRNALQGLRRQGRLACRPCLAGAVVWGAVGFAVFRLGPSWRYLAPAVILLAAVAGLLYFFRPTWRGVAGYLMAAVIAACWMRLALPNWYLARETASLTGLLQGRVVESQTHSLYLDELQLQTQDGVQALSGKAVLASIPEALQDLPPGSVVQLEATLRPPEDPPYPGGYDARTRMLLQGVRYQAVDTRGATVVSQQMWSGFARWRTALVRGLDSVLRRYVGGDAAALVRALLAGDRGWLSSSDAELFAQLGVAHLLAISGLHISVLLAFITYLERKHHSRPLTLVMSLGMLTLYLFFVGLRASILRAIILWLVWSLSLFARREYDSLNALGFAFLLLLFFQPLQLLDLGFQLSFGMTAGILALHPMLIQPVERLEKPWLLRLWSPLALTVAATASTWPWTLAAFRRWAWAAPLTNLLLVPMASVVLVLSLLFLFCYLLFPWAMAPVGGALGLLANSYLACVRGLGTVFPDSHALLVHTFWGGCSVAALALCSGKVLSLTPLRRVAAGVLAVLCIIPALWPGRTAQPVIRCIPGNRGVVTLVEEEGRRLVVASAEETLLATVLDEVGWWRVDTLVLLEGRPQSLASQLQQLRDKDIQPSQALASAASMQAAGEDAPACVAYRPGQTLPWQDWQLALGEATVTLIGPCGSLHVGRWQQLPQDGWPVVLVGACPTGQSTPGAVIHCGQIGLTDAPAGAYNTKECGQVQVSLQGDRYGLSCYWGEGKHGHASVAQGLGP